MNTIKTLSIPILLVLLSFGIFSCSKGESPIESSMNPAQEPSCNFPVSFESRIANRTTLAVYDVLIDPSAGSFTVTPISRESQYHTLLTWYFPDVLQVADFGWTPDFWADIKLTHPLPGSGIDVYDPRVIAILSANPGVSMDYPIFNVQSNDSVILEPDGYTKLFDSAHPSMPGNTNPFMSYFKSQPYRVWSSTGVTEETRRWQMDISGFGGPIRFVLVVDISTNYPNPSQPIIDNQPEPIILDATVGPGMSSDGGSAEIEVTFLDWQGYSDIKCKVESPDLFDGAIQLFYSEPGPNPNEYIFRGTITNSHLTPEGNYPLLVAAWDIPTDIHTFQEVDATVCDEIIFNPIDVTPPWLNIECLGLCVDGNYMYVLDEDVGIHVYDISDPQNPVWLNKFWEVTGEDIQVSNGYAYIVDSENDMHIVQLSPPWGLNVVKTVPNTEGSRVFLFGDYACLTDNNLTFIDINPPEDAHVVKIVESIGYAVDIAGGYAYLAGTGGYLRIIDIDPIEDASVVKSVYTGGVTKDVKIVDHYALVLTGSGISIVELDPIELAHVVDFLDISFECQRMNVKDDTAFVNSRECFTSVDIDPVEEVHILNSLDTGLSDSECAITENNAIVYSDKQILFLNVETPDNIDIVHKMYFTENITDVAFADGIACFASDDWSEGLYIARNDPPESTRNVNLLPLVNRGAEAVDIDGNYAYAGSIRLSIVDISDPENAFVANTIWDYYGVYIDVYAEDGYVYCTCHDEDDFFLIIADVDPIMDAHIVKVIENYITNGHVEVIDNYAYVSGTGSLLILDVTSPESANIVSMVPLPGGNNEFVIKDGYAYIARGVSDIQIVDIDPPESAYLANSFWIAGEPRSIAIIDKYLLVDVDYDQDYFTVLNVDDPLFPQSVYSYGSPGIANRINVHENYAYLSYGYGTRDLKIIKLF